MQDTKNKLNFYIIGTQSEKGFLDAYQQMMSVVASALGPDYFTRVQWHSLKANDFAEKFIESAKRQDFMKNVLFEYSGLFIPSSPNLGNNIGPLVGKIHNIGMHNFSNKRGESKLDVAVKLALHAYKNNYDINSEFCNYTLANNNIAGRKFVNNMNIPLHEDGIFAQATYSLRPSTSFTEAEMLPLIDIARRVWANHYKETWINTLK